MDDVVSSKLKLVSEKLDKLQTEYNKKKKYNTSCSIEKSKLPMHYNGSGRLNLHTLNQGDLVQLLAVMLTQDTYQKKANELLGLVSVEGEYDGFKVSEWIEDIKLLSRRLTLKDEIAKLTRIQHDLDNLVSEDLRKSLELSRVLSELESL
jgi:hypothetical protein